MCGWAVGVALSPTDCFCRDPQELMGRGNPFCKQVGGKLVGLSMIPQDVREVGYYVSKESPRHLLLAGVQRGRIFAGSAGQWAPAVRWLMSCGVGAAGQGDYGQQCPGRGEAQAAWGGVASRFSASISISVTLVGPRGLKVAGAGQWRSNHWFLRFL